MSFRWTSLLHHGSRRVMSALSAAGRLLLSLVTWELVREGMRLVRPALCGARRRAVTLLAGLSARCDVRRELLGRL